MNRCFLILVFFSGFFVLAQGQDAKNPFELKHRLASISAPDGISASASNPFDVKPHRQPGAAVALAENTTEEFRPSSLLPRHGNSLPNAALFWTLAGMFAFLTFCVATNRKVVGKAWRGFLSDNGLAVAQREASGFVGLTPYFLLYGSFLLNAGMFMFLLVRLFRPESFNNWLFLLICILAAGVIFLSKHILLNITSWLFPVGKEVQRYNFLIVIFNCVLGLFLLPFNFLLAFSSTPKDFDIVSADEYRSLLAFWTLGLVTIFYVYRAVRSAGISSKFLADNKFHFLLYLCAVEIAPVLLLVKLAMIQAKI